VEAVNLKVLQRGAVPVRIRKAIPPAGDKLYYLLLD
jgi:hypothetical protein